MTAIKRTGSEPFEQAAPTARASSLRTTESTVFIDVGARKIDANIIRDGVVVGVLQPDTERLSDIIAERPPLRMRIISQSVAPGTAVPLGTTVNVTLAPSGGLPVGIMTGTHVAVREATIDETFTRLVAGNPQVGVILNRAAGGALSTEDEQRVRDIFVSEGIEVTDQPGRDVTAAVETLRVLSTFGR
jgi:hypothetical protein